MGAFPNWQKFAVHQRRQATGCIPTSYEIILRAAGIQGIDFNSFQDDFDIEEEAGLKFKEFASIEQFQVKAV